MSLVLASPLLLDNLLALGQLYYFSTLSSLFPSPLYNNLLGDQILDPLSSNPWSFYHSHITLGLLVIIYFSPLYSQRTLNAETLISFLLLGLFWVKLDLNAFWIWDPIELLAFVWLAGFLTIQHKALGSYFVLPFLGWLAIFLAFYYLPSLHWPDLAANDSNISSKRKLVLLLPPLFYNKSDLCQLPGPKVSKLEKNSGSLDIVATHIFIFLIYLNWVIMVFFFIVIDISQAIYLAGTSA